MTLYVGVDIGLDGAISVLNDKQKVRHMFPMNVIKGKKTNYDIPAIVKIFETLKEHDELFVVIEKPIPRPIISCNANFMLGGGLFLFEAIMVALRISYQIITARTWQKDILKGLPKDTKTASIMFCKRKWPDVNLKKTVRSKKDHDGISDSILLALFGFKLNNRII